MSVRVKDSGLYFLFFFLFLFYFPFISIFELRIRVSIISQNITQYDIMWYIYITQKDKEDFETMMLYNILILWITYAL